MEVEARHLESFVDLGEQEHVAVEVVDEVLVVVGPAVGEVPRPDAHAGG